MVERVQHLGMSRFTVYIMINEAVFSMLIIMEMLMLLNLYCNNSLLIFFCYFFRSLFFLPRLLLPLSVQIYRMIGINLSNLMLLDTKCIFGSFVLFVIYLTWIEFQLHRYLLVNKQTK